MHFICIVNSAGRIVYKALYKPDTFESAEPEDLKDANSVLYKVVYSGDVKIIRAPASTSLGYLMLSIPVSDSYMKAPPEGKIIMGRFLNSEEQNR